MKSSVLVVSVFFFVLSGASWVHADEDIFASYKKDMRKDADARAISVYNAYADNMANMIEHNARDGIVIDGAGDYGKGVRADGLGNVTIDKNAKVGTIINKTKTENTTVILKNMNRFK